MKKRNAFQAAAVIALSALLLAGCGQGAGTAYTDSGYDALEAQDYSAAMEAFNTALDSGEDGLQVWRGIGLASLGQGNYETAEDAFDQALTLADDRMPETVQDLLLYKALTRYRQKDYDGTVETCDLLIGEQADVRDAYFYRGAACLMRGDTDKARANFDYAVSLDPDDYGLYLDIYRIYESQNQSGIGDTYLQTALGIGPQSEEDNCRLGEIYYYLEQYDKAQEVLSGPVAANNLTALDLQGKVYLARGDTDNAKAIYLKIQEVGGENAESYNGLALCALAAGDPDTALTYIAQGLALDGADGKQALYFNEIVACERKLDFAAALEKAEAFVQMYPADEAGLKEVEFLRTRV